ncbi:hypothetical protein EYV94_02600 [Puteibacter caeruleilacunae]|nr:hypothetical protein EYV94_02600 [Puteibacter caeruleilacunae]
MMNKTTSFNSICLFFISNVDTGYEASIYHGMTIDTFEGTWELKGRDMFDGLVVEIERNDHNDLIGKVVKTNNNKYVRKFVDAGDTWVAGIKKSHGSEFVLSEQKIAGELFNVYGQNSTTEFDAHLVDKDTISLRPIPYNPRISEIIYKRVK